MGLFFPDVTISHIFPVDKTELSVCILVFTVISFGNGGSDWLIKFGSLVTFCLLIDSLGNVFFQKLVRQISPFLYFSLSLDDSKSLGASSSSLSMFFSLFVA